MRSGLRPNSHQVEVSSSPGVSLSSTKSGRAPRSWQTKYSWSRSLSSSVPSFMSLKLTLLMVCAPQRRAFSRRTHAFCRTSHTKRPAVNASVHTWVTCTVYAGQRSRAGVGCACGVFEDVPNEKQFARACIATNLVEAFTNRGNAI